MTDIQKFYHSLFEYDTSCSTCLRWRHRPISHFDSVKGWKGFELRYAGKMAGSEFNTYGYKYYAVVPPKKFKHLYNEAKAHRIIYIMHYGSIPDKHVIDHKDGNPLNNKIENLRVATKGQNRQNAVRQKSSSCGLKGITKKGGSWIAQIRENNKVKHIGSYKTPEEAHEAYKEWAKRLYGEFARFE